MHVVVNFTSWIARIITRNKTTHRKNSTHSEGWTGVIDYLRPGLQNGASLPIYVMVSAPFWRRKSYRVGYPLPVLRLDVSRDTWELCIFVPGLIKRNAVGTPGVSFEGFLKELEGFAESAGHCHLVLSDELPVSRSELGRLFRRPKYNWEGVQAEGLPEGDYVARLDLPVMGMSIEVHEKEVLLTVKV